MKVCAGSRWISTFDNHRMDGLLFCRAVYNLFDQIRQGPDGISKIRLRPTKQEKRLVEELVPLARFVQVRYREGRRIRVRWCAGSQPYDAIVTASDGYVDRGMTPRRQVVEITACVHRNDHLVRRSLETPGPKWSAKSTWWDKRRSFDQSPTFTLAMSDRSISPSRCCHVCATRVARTIRLARCSSSTVTPTG